EVRGAVTEIDALFSLARHVAIARAVQSTLDIDPVRGVIAVRVGPDTVMKRELGIAHRVTLQSTRASITYSQTGIGYGAANLPLLQSSSARVLSTCDLSECIAVASIPFSERCLTTLSAPCLVRVNTSTESSSLFSRSSANNSVFFSFGTG